MLCHASLVVSSFPSGCYSYQVEILQNKHKPIVRAGLQTVGQEIGSDKSNNTSAGLPEWQ